MFCRGACSRSRKMPPELSCREGAKEWEINSSSATLREERYGGQLLEILNNQRLEGKFTDAILCVDEEELSFHRNILAASSPYFDAMLSAPMREAREARVAFTLNGGEGVVSPWVAKRLLTYAYTGHLDIPLSHAHDYVRAAHLLHYPRVVEAAAELLLKHIHPQNAAGLREFAALYECDSLEQSAHIFILENFVAVAESGEWCDLPVEKVREYLANDDLDIAREEVAAEAALRWAAHSLDERQGNLPSLILCLRVANLSDMFIDKLRNVPGVRNSVRCLELINGALAAMDCETELADEWQRIEKEPRPADSSNEIYVTGQVKDRGNPPQNRPLELSSPTKNGQNGFSPQRLTGKDLEKRGEAILPKMTPRPSTLERTVLALMKLSDHAMPLYPQPLCLITYDPSRDRWHDLQTVITATSYSVDTSAASNGDSGIPGPNLRRVSSGFVVNQQHDLNGQSTHGSPARRTSTSSSITMATSAGWTGSEHGLFVTGGISANRLISDVWHLTATSPNSTGTNGDTSSHHSGHNQCVWTSLPALPTPRAKHASAVHCGVLYVLGGVEQRTNTDGEDLVVIARDILAYSPHDQMWYVVGSVLRPRVGSQALVHCDTLYEVGGMEVDEDGVELEAMGDMLTSPQRSIALYHFAKSRPSGTDGVRSVQSSGEHLVLPLPASIETRHNAASSPKAAFLGGYLYLMWDGLRDLIALSPVTRIFQPLPPCLETRARSRHAMCAMNGRLYVSGGLIGGEPATEGECYDPTTRQWSVFKTPCDHRLGSLNFTLKL